MLLRDKHDKLLTGVNLWVWRSFFRSYRLFYMTTQGAKRRKELQFFMQIKFYQRSIHRKNSEVILLQKYRQRASSEAFWKTRLVTLQKWPQESRKWYFWIRKLVFPQRRKKPELGVTAWTDGCSIVLSVELMTQTNWQWINTNTHTYIHSYIPIDQPTTLPTIHTYVCIRKTLFTWTKTKIPRKHKQYTYFHRTQI